MANIPKFLKQSGIALLYNGTSELVYYVPDDYFTDVKNPNASIVGQYVYVLGVFDWGIVDEHGKLQKSHIFKYPTMIQCKPYTIEKIKGLSLRNTKPKDYQVLHFKNGDEAISNINLPNSIDNVESLFSMMVINGGKQPNTIPYDKLHEYFEQSMKINGYSFGINMQFFGILISELERDPNDLSKPFRYTPMSDMTKYQQISIKTVPKYTSPFIALTSENFDESLMASVMLSTEDEDKIKDSPLEKVVMA